MNSNSLQTPAVPTNIITGFLGVGKTSAILYLLSQKPAHERWAVLVNEFGEIGVDGSLLNGQYSKEQGIFIREVPGGCMCCASGLPMQIALNQLLSKAKPDRLLIEPTGLGHPKEVLQVLSAEYYKKVLSVQKTLTLVDARKLTDQRYTSHDTFNQQIAIADTIIGNKLDKTGGLTEALNLARRAKQKGMMLMVGNMVGTSLAMAPAYVIAQLCDFVDLDGALFLQGDRCFPMSYENGVVSGLSTQLWG